MDIDKFKVNENDHEIFTKLFYNCHSYITFQNRFQNYFFGIVTDYKKMPNFDEDNFIKSLMCF